MLDHTSVGCPQKRGCGQRGDGLVAVPVSIGLDDLQAVPCGRTSARLPPPRDGHVRWVEAPHVAGQHHRLPRALKGVVLATCTVGRACTGGRNSHEGGYHPGFSSNLALLLQCFLILPTHPPRPHPRPAHIPLKMRGWNILLCTLPVSHSIPAPLSFSFLQNPV